MGQISRFSARAATAFLAVALPLCCCQLKDVFAAPQQGVPLHDHGAERDDQHDHGSCPGDDQAPCSCGDVRGDGLPTASPHEPDGTTGPLVTGSLAALQNAGRAAVVAMTVGTAPQMPPATLLAQGCSLLV